MPLTRFGCDVEDHRSCQLIMAIHCRTLCSYLNPKQAQLRHQAGPSTASCSRTTQRLSMPHEFASSTSTQLKWTLGNPEAPRSQAWSHLAEVDTDAYHVGAGNAVGRLNFSDPCPGFQGYLELLTTSRVLAIVSKLKAAHTHACVHGAK